MTVVWLQTVHANTYVALYPTNTGLIPIGYTIEQNGKWKALSYRDLQNVSLSFSDKQEAAQYLLSKV